MAKIGSGTTPTATTTTSLTTSTGVVSFGTPVTFTASVTGASPTGSVVFYDGSTLLQSVALVSTQAILTTSTLAAGTHSITARYTGDTENLPSVSAPVAVTVNAYPTVSLTSPANNAYFIAPATINLIAQADVTGGSVSKVEFYRGTNLLATVTSSPYVFSGTNVQVGKYSFTAKATSTAGLVTTSTPVTIAVLSAPVISLNNLVNGAVIADDNLTVTGQVKAPANSSISINGIVGSIGSDGRFFVNNVPLVPGANTLTITITTPDGKLTTQTIQVTSSAKAPFVFSASPTEGLAPLTVNFTLMNRNNVAFARIELSCLGDGTITRTLTAPSLALGACTYTTPGLYKAKMRVINAQKQVIYTSYQAINVKSASDQDAMLQNVYYSMLAQLKVKNINGALNYVTGGVRDKYNSAFTAMQTSLPTIVDQLGTLQNGVLGGDMAEYVVVRNQGGANKAFLLYLIRGEDGIWRIDGM